MGFLVQQEFSYRFTTSSSNAFFSMNIIKLGFVTIYKFKLDKDTSKFTKIETRNRFKQ